MKLTNFKKSNFNEILENYNIGKYKSSKHIWWAFENTVYFLNTNKGKFVLKVFEKSDLECINFQTKVINFIYKKKLPIQKIIKAKSKKNVLIYNGKKILVYEFIDGKEPKKINNKLLKNVSKNFGLLSKNLLKLKLQGKYRWRKDYPFKPIEDRAGIINGFNFVEEEKKLLRNIRKLNKKKLRKSVIHGDFHGANFLVKNDKLVAIIDWDDIREEFLAFEIAVFIAHTFVRKINANQFRLFFKEYQKYVKLNEEEKKAIYYFIKYRYLGVIGWCTVQRKKHRDKSKELGKWIKEVIKCYKTFSKIPLEEFLSWI